MLLFQGADAWFWLWLSVFLTAATGLMVWYFTVTGVDRPPTRQRRGEDALERYGDIEEDRAPLSKFLIWTYVGVGIWAFAYVLWTGVYGLGN